MLKSELTKLPSFFIEYKEMCVPHNMPVEHYHDSYEIYFQISGARNFFVNDNYYPLSHGDILLINPFELHYSISCKESIQYSRYVMNLKMDSLYSILNSEEASQLFELFKYNKISLTIDELDNVISLLKKIDTESKIDFFLSQKYSRMATVELLLSLLRIAQGRFSLNKEYYPQNDLIRAIQYIKKNYNRDITLADAAAYIHVTKYHFCRIFKQFTGATFLQYLNNLRLSEAHRLLATTELPLSHISEEVGFSDTAHFSRIFKQVHGYPPRNFNRKSSE